jgi:hypothetical protein
VGGEHVEISEERPEYQKVRRMFEERAKTTKTLSLQEYYEWAEDVGLTQDQVKSLISFIRSCTPFMHTSYISHIVPFIFHSHS